MQRFASCIMCGGERKPGGGSSEFCCEGCELAYAETHSSQLIAAGIPSDAWSYRARCAASVALSIGDENSDRFQRSVKTLETLKERLQAMQRELPKGDYGDGVKMREWIASFDRLMRSLDAIFSEDFAAKLAEHVVEFDNIHGASAGASNAAEVKLLLAELARALPMNRLIAEKRSMLQSVLDKQAPNVRDKFILALDGGGIRGMVTIVLLIELMRRVRLKSGKPSAKLSDCFHMIIGTSTGGIIAALVAVLDKQLEEILELYLTMGSKVFGEKNKVTGSLNPMTMLVHYSDYEMLLFLRDLFGVRRLDDDATRFKDESLRGPNGVRFAVSTLDISHETSDPMLLRNYEPAPGCGMVGTNRAFVIEAVRSTSSAVTYFHPWRRYFAPLRSNPNPLGVASTTYDTNASGMLHENIEIILDGAPSKQDRELLAKIVHNDSLMNAAATTDGGTWANNPVEVAIEEIRELYAQDQVSIHVANFGTGLMPRSPSRTWSSHGIRNPAERNFVGEHNMREVFSDLIVGAVVSPATDTERIARRAAQFYGDMASITRINPPLRKIFKLDDISESAAREMMEDVKAYITSKEGDAALERLAVEIVAYSDRLKALQ